MFQQKIDKKQKHEFLCYLLLISIQPSTINMTIPNLHTQSPQETTQNSAQTNQIIST